MKRNEIEFDAEALVGSVESFAAHVQGKQKLTLRTNQLSLPAPIKPIGPQDITALRQQLNVSQAVFAGLLNVPKVTAISWEKGRRRPTGAALRLLDLIRKKPQILQEAWPRRRAQNTDDPFDGGLTDLKPGPCRCSDPCQSQLRI